MCCYKTLSLLVSILTPQFVFYQYVPNFQLYRCFPPSQKTCTLMDFSVPAHFGIKATSDKSFGAVGLPELICAWRFANCACKLSICCRNFATAIVTLRPHFHASLNLPRPAPNFFYFESFFFFPSPFRIS